MSGGTIFLPAPAAAPMLMRPRITTPREVPDGGSNGRARRRDCLALLDLMRGASGHEPRMWGSIVGLGSYHYRYEIGREGDSFLTGSAPRRNDLTIYVETRVAHG
jgi:hypothetical protein